MTKPDPRKHEKKFYYMGTRNILHDHDDYPIITFEMIFESAVVIAIVAATLWFVFAWAG